MDDVEIPQTAFSVYEPARPGLMPILYQTGYLTIQSARDDGGIRLYRLVQPNFGPLQALMNVDSKIIHRIKTNSSIYNI